MFSGVLFQNIALILSLEVTIHFEIDRSLKKGLHQLINDNSTKLPVNELKSLILPVQLGCHLDYGH